MKRKSDEERSDEKLKKHRKNAPQPIPLGPDGQPAVRLLRTTNSGVAEGVGLEMRLKLDLVQDSKDGLNEGSGVKECDSLRRLFGSYCRVIFNSITLYLWVQITSGSDSSMQLHPSTDSWIQPSFFSVPQILLFYEWVKFGVSYLLISGWNSDFPLPINPLSSPLIFTYSSYNTLIKEFKLPIQPTISDDSIKSSFNRFIRENVYDGPSPCLSPRSPHHLLMLS